MWMTRTETSPPAMVPGPSHVGQLSPPGGEPESVGEHLKCGRQWGLREGGSLGGWGLGLKGPGSSQDTCLGHLSGSHQVS